MIPTQDINPYRNLSADIAPAEFELFCMETVKAFAEQEKLQNVSILHNQRVQAPDSTYQIDILVKYTALNCLHTVIVECKKYTRSIERATVAELYSKVQSIGAQKGILISTSGFQSDAVKFAGVHGIALWQICDQYIKHITASLDSSPLSFIIQQEEKMLPRFFVLEWDCSADYPYKEIYPTQSIHEQANKAIMQLQIKEENNNV